MNDLPDWGISAMQEVIDRDNEAEQRKQEAYARRLDELWSHMRNRLAMLGVPANTGRHYGEETNGTGLPTLIRYEIDGFTFQGGYRTADDFQVSLFGRVITSRYVLGQILKEEYNRNRPAPVIGPLVDQRDAENIQHC